MPRDDAASVDQKGGVSVSDTESGRRPNEGGTRAGAGRRRDEGADVDRLHEEARLLDEEVTNLRRRVADGPKRVRALEERLLETKGQLAQAVAQNEKLSYTLREAREHIAALRDEVDKLTRPPSAYGWSSARTTTARSTSSRAAGRCG